MKTWNERLKHARTERGLKRIELANLVKVSTASTSDWESGVVKSLDATNLLKICNALRISPEWLMNGTGNMETHNVIEPRAMYNTEPAPSIKHNTPLISWVQAGAWSDIHDHFVPGDAEDYLPCPVNHSPSTFALRVRGESMINTNGRPTFFDGDLIFVDPERPALNGSLVVVRLDNSQEATFKKLIIEGNKKYLRPLNTAWPEPIIEINDNATICGVVIFKGERI